MHQAVGSVQRTDHLRCSAGDGEGHQSANGVVGSGHTAAVTPTALRAE